MIVIPREILYQQIDWYYQKLKPYVESKTLSYWAEHPEEYKRVHNTEEWYVKVVRVYEEDNNNNNEGKINPPTSE